MEQLEPWERQRDETDTAWQAFTRYRDMPKRSLRMLAQELVWGEETAKGRQKRVTGAARQRRLEAWSVAHHWRERVVAWDRELDRQKREAIRERHLVTIENHMRLIEQTLAIPVNAMRQEPLLQKLADELLREVQRGNGLPTFLQMQAAIRQNAMVMVRLIEAERLVRGMSTANIVQQATEVREPFAVADDPTVAAAISAYAAALTVVK